MWGNERTWMMLAEERIRRYRQEAEETRRAEQASRSRGSTKLPGAGLRDGIRRLLVRGYLLPLLASVRRP